MRLFGTEEPPRELNEDEDYFNLISSDKKEFKVGRETIKQSTTLYRMISHLKISATAEDKIIPVDNVNSEILEVILQWCEHHRGEPIPENDGDYDKNVVISEWDENFLHIDNESLYHLICAANYLDIQQLMTLCCKKVALMANRRTPEELRIIFGISTDEEDRAAARGQLLPIRAPEIVEENVDSEETKKEGTTSHELD